MFLIVKIYDVKSFTDCNENISSNNGMQVDNSISNANMHLFSSYTSDRVL